MPLLIRDPHEGLLPISSGVFSWQINSLISLARSYHYKPVFELVIQGLDAGPRKNFVMQMHSISFLSFVVEWCKVFGTNNNSIHWKKLYYSGTPLDDMKRLSQEAFERHVRSAILRYSGVTQDDFNKAYSSVKAARDRFAAHIDINDIPPMPFLEIPYRIANALTVLFTGFVGDPFRDLNSYHDEFVAEIEAVLVVDGN